MPISLQAKILRTIQNQEILRLGGREVININVRFIAATNKDLYTLVKQDKFRQDLYYRLNTGIFRLPPLRERKEDIPALVEFFTSTKKHTDRNKIKVNTEVMNFFLEYDWPGNIRELQSVVLYANAICRDEEIKKEHLPEYILTELENPVAAVLSTTGTDKINDEKALILKTLKEMNFNKKDTADKLGISRPTLYRKMEKHNISRQKNDANVSV